MAASSLLCLEENYVLPSSNSSKPLQYLIEVIGLDHGYSKPWSSQQRVPNPRPVKTMFSRDAEVLNTTHPKAKTSAEGQAKAEEMLIDVESVDDANPSGPHAIKMQYDVSKSKIAMGECERYVSSVSSKRTPDTWEELICRTGWTNQQNVLFDKILKIVSSYRLARLTHEESVNEPVLCKVALDKATKRVRQILSRIEWDSKLTTWLHSSMIDGLSIPLLACYLDILQTLRSKVPSLVDQMIASPTSHRRVSAGTTDNMTSLLKRPWDATIGLSSFQRQRKVSGPPLLLIVPSGPTTNSPANATKRSRFWHHHMSNLGKVIPVTMHLSNSARGVSIGQCLDHMIGAVQAKVLELKNHFPNRPVVLIGWSTGALVSFQVSLVESVCAVVCLGFPLLGLEGLRGENEDPFLESKTPMMFVFGTLSNCCSLSDIEEFRKKLVSETSLLVIGGADDQLRLTCSKKKMEGVTQSMVDRRIMDEIGEFLGNAVSSMNNVQNRSDYFDFDEIESRRKKPKAQKRKRAATNDSGAAGEGTSKKPRKVTKAATPKTQVGAAKKTKAVKTVKRSTVDKPIVCGPTLAPGPPPVRVTGSIPISTLPSGSIAAGIVRGVPVSAVNVPVSAVIKQGSLGGRSLVFSCSPPTGTTQSPTNPVPTMMMTSGGTGNTQCLNVVMGSTPGTAMMSSSVRQPLVQYKPGTSPLLAKSTSSVTTSAAIRTVTPAVLLSSSAAATKTSAKTAQMLVTSPAMTSSSVTTGSLITPSGSSPLITKGVLGSQGVANTPNPRAAAVPTSGQAQFIMRKGCLSAVTKPTTVRVSTPLTTNAGQGKSIPSSLAQRVASPAQLISTTASDPAAKQSVGRLASVPVTSQTATSLVRRTPLPQSPATRTIQVGVTDPKKQLPTKRTVTYSPSTTTKGITVVSRSVSSPSVPYRTGPQILKHLTQDLNRQTTTKPLTSAQSQSIQLATALSFGAPSSSLQRASAQLVSASLTSAQAASALTKSALTKSALSTKSLASSSSLSTQASTTSLYHNSDDEKLVEKIRGIVKDVVGSTSRFTMKCDRKQTIVVTTKSATTSALASAVTTATKEEAQRRLCERVKENKSNDEDGKK